MVVSMETTAAATHEVVNMKAARWMTDGFVTKFTADRPGFGVREVATGRFVSSNGVAPSVWSTKAVAACFAANPPAWSTCAVTGV